MRQIFQNYFKRVPGRILSGARVLIGLVVLYHVLGTSNPSAIARLTEKVWLPIFVALLPIIGAAIEAQRLRLLLGSQGIEFSLARGYRFVAIGTLFNFAIPGGTGGDLMKGYYIASENPGTGVAVTIGILLDRILALFALLCLVALLAAMSLDKLLEYPVMRLLASIVMLGLLGLLAFGVLALSRRSSSFFQKLIVRFSWLRRFERVRESLYLYRTHKDRLLWVILLSFFGHVLLAGMFVAVGNVMFPEVNARWIAFLALLGMFANALPITPGGLGVGEYALETLFKVAGYLGGANLMLAWRLGMVPVCLLGGLFYIRGGEANFRVSDKIMSDVSH